MKPKQNHAADPQASQTIDRCQTPGYALDPLLPYLRGHEIIWEPAAGEGNIARTLRAGGWHVATSDILAGQEQNFFTYTPRRWDVQVTNPPYSCKYDWLERSYALGKPFALLVPVETIAAGRAVRLFQRYGVEILMPDRRVNFKMPNAGWGGTAQFPTCWITWGLGIGSPLTFVNLTQRAEGQLVLFDMHKEVV